MSIQVDIKALLEAGFHFGHQKQRWNPKMKPFIYGEKNGVHIVDLSKSANLFNTALSYIGDAVADGSDVLFVATKRQAQDIVSEEATRCNMFYVNNRWMGGTLTNFKTVKTSIDRLKRLIKGKEDGSFDELKKAERLMIDREIQRLEKSLSGIKNLSRVPDLVVIIDPNKEHLALEESIKLGLNVIALTDTNCDPDNIDYVVPGNDDATKSIRCFFSLIADAILEALPKRESRVRQRANQAQQDKAEENSEGVREVMVANSRSSAYVFRPEGAAEAEVAETYSATPEVAEASGTTSA